MIQVCSQCGTRWNVRDRQRAWCPRCHGALMAPSGAPDPRWSPSATTRPPNQQRSAPRLAPGFRWIAVRPGPPPPPRHRRRPLGPTPRYLSIPRWGLGDQMAPTAGADGAGPRKGPSPATVRAALLSAVTVFGLAALVHIARYVLLLINRTSLLPPLVATGALWLGVLVNVAAMVATVLAAVVLTSWLIARRSAVFKHLGQDDPRRVWALWVGCLVPVVNLVWAPVFVIELAHAEDSQARLRGPIVAWWVTWVFSTAIAIFASATSFTTEPQGVADNTVSTIIAYLVGMATVLLLWRVVDGFVRKAVERPLHRWVIVGDDLPAGTESPPAVEPEQQEPAA